MGKVFGWIVVIVLIIVACKAGWVNSVINYFDSSYTKAKQERVIEESDGSVTTVRYRNIFDILTGK